MSRSSASFLALLPCLALACHGPSASSPPSTGPLRCSPGGSFAAPNEQGALTEVPDNTSRATIVELWARWCKGCSQAVPSLLEHRDDLQSDGVRVVLLGALEDGESITDARATLSSWSVREPFIVDRGAILMRRYGFTDLPASVVLDAKGNLRWTSSKGSTAEDAMAAAREAVARPCP